MVKFKLYEADGTTLRYTFPVIFSANYPHSERNIIEHSNFRGKGSIPVDGGMSSWDLVLRGVLSAENYDDLMVLVADLEDKVVLNSPYVLKITKSATTTWDYFVKRITPIEYPEDSLRINFIEYTCKLRVYK